ncbi:MAG: protoporphyrinogen oxidase [Acidimicrobiales bacterium]
MKRAVVIGGGVSGLAAARLLAGGEPVSAAGAGLLGAFEGWQVVLLEASGRLGGKVVTATGARPVELGPDQFLRRDPSALNLCRQLGLEHDLVEPAAGTAAVFSRGMPRQLPGGLVLGVPTDMEALSSSGVVGDEAVAFAAGEGERHGEPLTAADVGLDVPGVNGPAAADAGGADGATAVAEDPESSAGEISAGEILRRRLGDEIVDHLVDPLLGGINAGSVDHLSLGTAAPQLAGALVGRHDVIAPLKALATGGASGAGGPKGGSVVRARPTAAVASSPFFGLVGGLGRIVDRAGAELQQLGCDVRLNSPARSVRSVRQGQGGYIVDTAAGSIEADRVVLAVPAPAAAALLGDVAPLSVPPLAAVRYASVAVATLWFEPGSNPAIEGWTGVLVPRAEGAVATAVTFLSYKWPWIVETGGGPLVRMSAGRSQDNRAAALNDRDLGLQLVAELARFTGITARPSEVKVTRWPDSFPQYRPGHAHRVAAWQRALEPHPGIALAGAALGGIGIPACITSGERAVANLVAGSM